MSKRTVTAEELQRPLVPYRDALAQIVGAFAALEPVDVAVEDALGLVTPEPIIAPIDVPGFANSAMDGYAINSRDTSEPPVV
ncbi:MAG: gephyrin-like molybdotransferase Glp, partial [Actinomycetota bacterium]